MYAGGCRWRSCSLPCIPLWFSFSSQAFLALKKLPSDPVQALALLCSVFPTTAPPWISCRNKRAGSGMPVLAVTSVVSGRKPQLPMTHHCLLGFLPSPPPRYPPLIVFSPAGGQVQSLPLCGACFPPLSSFLPTPGGRQLLQQRSQSGAEMPLCHLENSCSSQAACSAGLISIGNLLTFVQLYIIDNGRALPRKAQLVVYSGLSVLLCSRCLPHQRPEARAAASHTPCGAGAAPGIPNSTLAAAELGM